MPCKRDHHGEVARILHGVHRSMEGAMDLLRQLHPRGKVQPQRERSMDRHEEENNQQRGEETPETGGAAADGGLSAWRFARVHGVERRWASLAEGPRRGHGRAWASPIDGRGAATTGPGRAAGLQGTEQQPHLRCFRQMAWLVERARGGERPRGREYGGAPPATSLSPRVRRRARRRWQWSPAMGGVCLTAEERRRPDSSAAAVKGFGVFGLLEVIHKGRA